MIPKIIHYCWFAGQSFLDEVKQFIESWKKYCPDYEWLDAGIVSVLRCV